MQNFMAKPLLQSTKFALCLTYIGLWIERFAQAYLLIFSLILCTIDTGWLGLPDSWPVEVIWLGVSAWLYAVFWGARLRQSMKYRPLIVIIQSWQSFGRRIWFKCIGGQPGQKLKGVSCSGRATESLCLSLYGTINLFVEMIFGSPFTFSGRARVPVTVAMSDPSWKV